MDAGARSAGFRVLRPQHPRQQRRRLHDLPWSREPDAAHGAGAIAADGVVPRLPSPARRVRAAAERGLQRELGEAREPDRGGSPSRRGVPDSATHELLNVSSMKLKFWRTLDELAEDPAFRERLYNEFPSEV